MRNYSRVLLVAFVCLFITGSALRSAQAQDLLDPSSPLSPTSPLSPANPMSPFNPLSPVSPLNDDDLPAQANPPARPSALQIAISLAVLPLGLLVMFTVLQTGRPKNGS